MARRPHPRAITNLVLTADSIDRKLKKYLSDGNSIDEVDPGATGQDEKNRSKHIVISRKPPAAPPGIIPDEGK